MIQNDKALKVTRERVTYLLNLLSQLRASSRPEELALVSGGYMAEVERMQRDVFDCLTQPATPEVDGSLAAPVGRRLGETRLCD